MDDQELRQLIGQLLALDQGAGPEIIPTTPLAEGGLELTSLELVRLLVNLEEQLGIELDDGEIMNAQLDTVEDILDLVRSSMPAPLG